MPTIEKKSILFYIMILMLWFTAFAHYYSESLNQIALYGIFPMVAIFAMIMTKKIVANRYFIILLILYGWLFICTITAQDMSVAMDEMKQIMGALMACFCMVALAQKEEHIPWLYTVYLVLFASSIYYLVTILLPEMKIGEDRPIDDILNANTLAYYTFFYAIITFILGETTTKLKEIWKIAFLCSIPISFEMAIITGSRQVPIIMFPLIGILIFYRYFFFQSRTKWKTILFIIAGIAILIYAIPTLMNIYNGSTLSLRNQDSVVEDERTILLREALQVGKEHPIFGIGPGNFRLVSSPQLFSHNTYAELWANSGLIGLLIYVCMTCIFCGLQYKRWKETKDTLFLIFGTCGFFYIVYQMFYVWYADNWLISFYMLLTTHSEVYYNANYVTIQEEKPV